MDSSDSEQVRAIQSLAREFVAPALLPLEQPCATEDKND